MSPRTRVSSAATHTSTAATAVARTATLNCAWRSSTRSPLGPPGRVERDAQALAVTCRPLGEEATTASLRPASRRTEPSRNLNFCATFVKSSPKAPILSRGAAIEKKPCSRRSRRCRPYPRPAGFQGLPSRASRAAAACPTMSARGLLDGRHAVLYGRQARTEAFVAERSALSLALSITRLYPSVVSTCFDRRTGGGVQAIAAALGDRRADDDAPVDRCHAFPLVTSRFPVAQVPTWRRTRRLAPRAAP